MIALVISIVAAIGAAASAYYAARALREARKANAIPALLDFLREYRGYEPDRRYVFNSLQACDPQCGVSGLPDPARKSVVVVCHYLDQLGFLVDQRMVEPEAVAGYMGESILRSWGALAPYIKQERTARNADYSQYFEDLAARVLAIEPKSVRKRLKKVPDNAELPARLDLLRLESVTPEDA